MTGIIDGSGSVGASIGQFTVGATETAYGWRYGYLLLVAIMQTITIIPLSKIFCDEIQDIKDIRARKEVDEKIDQIDKLRDALDDEKNE